MTLQGLLSNVLDVQRNLHPVNENTMAEIALPIFLGLKKELISLLFYLFLYLFICLVFFRKRNIKALRKPSLQNKNKQGK